MTTILELPQWQGSAAPQARRMAEGARLLASLFPEADRVRPALTDDSAPATTVRSADALRHNLAAIREALATVPADAPLITFGGDCAVELAPVERAHRIHGDRLALVWFDAHGDLNTPETSPSKAFHGMILRALLGEGPAELLPANPLNPSQVVLAGARALDPGEHDYLASSGLCHLPPEAVTPEALTEAVAGADAVYIHIDLDVLDPKVFASVGYPEPGGLTLQTLTDTVRALTANLTLAGLAVTEYQPTAPEDQDTVTRLIAGMTAP